MLGIYERKIVAPSKSFSFMLILSTPGHLLSGQGPISNGPYLKRVSIDEAETAEHRLNVP